MLYTPRFGFPLRAFVFFTLREACMKGARMDFVQEREQEFGMQEGNALDERTQDA
jgi:hypothetical protein